MGTAVGSAAAAVAVVRVSVTARTGYAVAEGAGPEDTP